MFGEECTLPMDVGLPRRNQDSPDPINNPYALWARDALEVAYDQVRCHAGRAVRRQKRMYDKRAVKRVFAIGDWTLRYCPPAKKCKLARTLFSGVPCEMASWGSTAPGFAGSYDPLPGFEESSSPQGSDLLVAI